MTRTYIFRDMDQEYLLSQDESGKLYLEFSYGTIGSTLFAVMLNAEEENSYIKYGKQYLDKQVYSMRTNIKKYLERRIDPPPMRS